MQLLNRPQHIYFKKFSFTNNNLYVIIPFAENELLGFGGHLPDTVSFARANIMKGGNE